MDGQYSVTQDWDNKTVGLLKISTRVSRQVYTVDSDIREIWSRGALRELGIPEPTITGICD